MIDVRVVDDVGEMGALCDLIEEVWDERLVIPELLRAVSYAGGYVAGAYDRERLVGASLGFLGSAPHLHSHITGVASSAQSHGVGFLVKHHQRAWCLERGIPIVEWTYDPSIARNAWFNLQRLGADVVAFEPDFYGDGADRFVVRWELADAAPREEPTIGADDVGVSTSSPSLRADLLAALADGREVVGVTRSGTYVLRRR